MLIFNTCICYVDCNVHCMDSALTWLIDIPAVNKSQSVWMEWIPVPYDIGLRHLVQLPLLKLPTFLRRQMERSCHGEIDYYLNKIFFFNLQCGRISLFFFFSRNTVGMLFTGSKVRCLWCHLSHTLYIINTYRNMTSQIGLLISIPISYSRIDALMLPYHLRSFELNQELASLVSKVHL